jgi:hypothetical protein
VAAKGNDQDSRRFCNKKKLRGGFGQSCVTQGQARADPLVRAAPTRSSERTGLFLGMIRNSPIPTATRPYLLHGVRGITIG